MLQGITEGFSIFQLDQIIRVFNDSQSESRVVKSFHSNIELSHIFLLNLYLLLVITRVVVACFRRFWTCFVSCIHQHIRTVHHDLKICFVSHRMDKVENLCLSNLTRVCTIDGQIRYLSFCLLGQRDDSDSCLLNVSAGSHLKLTTLSKTTCLCRYLGITILID